MVLSATDIIAAESNDFDLPVALEQMWILLKQATKHMEESDNGAVLSQIAHFQRTAFHSWGLNFESEAAQASEILDTAINLRRQAILCWYQAPYETLVFNIEMIK